MISAPHIRIFPLMVMVAMLAFSVRLVDFATGVSSLSGSAQAAAEAQEAPADAKMPDQGALKSEADQMAEAETAAGEEAKKEEAKAEEAPAEAMAETPAEEHAASAKADDHAEEKPAAKEDTKKDGPTIDWRDASDEETGFSEDKMAVFDDLSARREELDKRESELKTREALLKVTEQELERKTQELKQLRAELENLLDKQTDEEKARIASLVKIYEGMKPKEAARIFDTLDLDVLMSVTSKMSERKLAPVLAAMNPERAKTVTIMLAQEKKLPTLPGSN